MKLLKWKPLPRWMFSFLILIWSQHGFLASVFSNLQEKLLLMHRCALIEKYSDVRHVFWFIPIYLWSYITGGQNVSPNNCTKPCYLRPADTTEHPYCACSILSSLFTFFLWRLQAAETQGHHGPRSKHKTSRQLLQHRLCGDQETKLIWLRTRSIKENENMLEE